jgi:anaerobic selenocysteine-containing dehydrogenase/Fe-S-cluster-containing dehydrogenase component
MSQLALMIDLESCIGCKSCEAACKQEHGLGPDEYRNKVLWLETPGKPKVDFLTVTCQHCERPACLRACPVSPKAILKDPVTGVVSIDEDRCTGCGECVTACPYGAMGFDPIDQHAVKCDLCADRRSRDLEPACATVCPGQAIHFGDRVDLLEMAEGRAGRDIVDHDHYLMKPATIYLRREEDVSDAYLRQEERVSDAEPKVVELIEDKNARKLLRSAEIEAPYRQPRAERTAEKIIPGACNICFNGCPVKYHIRDGKLVGVSGNEEDPIFQGRICPKSQMTLQLYNNTNRLTRPLKRVGERGSGKFEEISWDQALDEIADKLKQLRELHGPETLALFSGTRSGSITNHGYVRLFQQMWGTPNLESTEPFCSSSKNLTFGMTQGQRILGNSYTREDIGSAGLFVYFGDNQAETRPVYFGMINEWRRQSGARMVVIDPRMSATATKADQWLGIRSGTDMALGLALLHHIFSNDLHDLRFCEGWVEGWERWRDFILERGYTPDWAAPITDISADDIRALAEEIAGADGCMIYGSRGVNQHSNSTQTNRILMFLAAITGNWGRPGGAYYNISTTHLVQANAPEDRRPEPGRPMVRRTPAGWYDAINKSDPYKISAMIAGNNPFAMWPSQETTREALKELDLLVHMDLFRNETSEFSDYVLPVATGIERGGISRAAEERRIVWNDQMIDPPGEARGDGWIWIELGKRLGFEDVLRDEYKDIATFWDAEMIDRDYMRGATVERFRASPTRTLRSPARADGTPAEETMFLEGTTAFGAEPGKRFSTPSGKLEFWTEEQEAQFAAFGFSALPEFYSEREQLIDLPYLESLEGPDDPRFISPMYPAPAYARQARIVDGANDTPGRRLRAAGFDTELITGRPPAPHFHSWTHYFWQAKEMWPDAYAQIHPSKATALGIKDGETIRVETTNGAIEARAWIRDGIRPTAVYMPMGWAEKQPNAKSWRPVNFLSDLTQRDPFAEQVNFKTRLCKVTRVAG